MAKIKISGERLVQIQGDFYPYSIYAVNAIPLPYTISLQNIKFTMQFPEYQKEAPDIEPINYTDDGFWNKFGTF